MSAWRTGRTPVFRAAAAEEFLESRFV